MATRDQMHLLEPAAGSTPDDIGPGLPFLEGGGLPEPESPTRTRLIRSIAVAALAVSAVYLAWRALFTIDLAVWFVALPMLVLEAHHALGLGLYTFSLWDLSAPPPPPPVIATDLRVALLIPTYDESAEVLLPVISAALALRPDHETWVLDDGNRPHIARLAADLGAQYLARSENADAKAGNLNNALRHIDADVIAVVDADHVVLPGFLSNTLGYFDDPRVAVVQTPQDFYNIDSFEHEERGEGRARFNEQTVFYRVILPAKNRWNAVFWCGTSALVRVAALREVGGVAAESVTEDIHTSIRMHKAGWRLLAHNEVLARGLAATDIHQYMIQRQRWARGAMQVMKSEQLLTSPALTPAQRIAYAATLIAWFDSLRSLFFVLLPIAVLATGAMPIDTPLIVFGPMFLGTFFMQFAALRMLARGHYPPMLSLTFETLRMPAVVPAFSELWNRGRKSRFRVTPKGRVGRTRPRAPQLISSLIALSLGAMVWAALTLAGFTPLEYRYPEAIFGTSVFLAGNVALLLVAARRVRHPKYAGELRASVRFPVDMAATVDAGPARLEDLSLTGARVWVPDLELDSPAARGVMTLGIPASDVALRVIVVRIRRSPRQGVELGMQFLPGQHEAVGRLSLLLFHAERQPTELAPSAVQRLAS